MQNSDFIQSNGEIRHKILTKEFWKPTLQLNTIIMALEFELINILDNSHNDKNIADN